MERQEPRVESQEPEGGAVGRERAAPIWPLVALLVVAAAVLVSLQLRRPEPPTPWEGAAMPPLNVDGWLNTEVPLTAENLRGRVVLIDFWATNCGACLQHMPDVADYRKRFADEGVAVVGLTHEPASAVERIERVVSTMDIGWPIGYGAGNAFAALGIYGTPTYILFDRTGRSVWSGHSLSGLEDATIAALAK